MDEREAILKDLRAAERDLKRARKHVEEVKWFLENYDKSLGASGRVGL